MYRILVCIPLLLLALPRPLASQENAPWSIWQTPSTRNFAVIQQQAEAWFANNPRGKHSGYKQWKRWEYATQRRLLPNGEIANCAALNWKADQKSAHRPADQRGQVYGGTWDQLAPLDGYVGTSGNPGLGRVNVIAFHPSDPNTVFAGTPAGGLWKTSNAGVDWIPLTDGIPSIGVSGIVVHPTSPNTIYILTGDGDGAHTPSIGVLKTTDGGLNWANTGLTWDVTELNRGYKLVMHPDNPQILLVACNDGLLRTTDGGTVWDTVFAGNFYDIEFKPDNPTVVYAARNDRFYRSDNSGATWTEYDSGLPTGESRIAIAVTPDNPDYVYYLAGPGGPTGSFKGLYRSVDSGETWAVRTTTPNILDGSVAGDASCASGCDQATYDLAIAIDPDDAEEVITGGINLWRDENGGGTLLQLVAHWIIGYAPQFVHGDIHELVFQDNNTLWCGSDGGIFRSTDDGVTWQDMSSVGSNGLLATQFYRIAGVPGNANLMIGGTQDNGTNKWTGGSTIWHFAGADGMDCMIDHSNWDVLYLSTQNGGLRKSTDGGLTHNPIKPGNSNGGWVTPMVMDPINPQRIYAGFRDTVWRSDNGGSSWTPTVTTITLATIQSLAIAPSDPDRIYAAKSNNIYRSDSIGVGWTEITATLPVAGMAVNITRIAVDDDNPDEVWVTLSGYTAGQKVYYSDNAGLSWTNVSGSLPNVPVNCIVYDSVQTNDNAIYVGTDIGVFYRDATLGDWVPFRNGLPVVPIRDLEIHASAQKLRAGTFGRGIWESDLYDACPNYWFLTNGTLTGSGVQGHRYYQAAIDIVSGRDLYGGIATNVIYQAANSVILTEGFQAHAGIQLFEARTGPCGGGVPPEGLQVLVDLAVPPGIGLQPVSVTKNE